MDNLSLLDVNRPEKVKSAINELIEYKNNATAVTEVTKASIGLGNVDNTSDLNKPLSASQQEYIDEVNAENVKLESDSRQKLESDIEIAEGKSLYGERSNGTAEPLISVKNEGGYEAVKVGSNKIPLRLQHSMKDISETPVSKNPKITIKNASGVDTEDSLALSSDIENLRDEFEDALSDESDNYVSKTVLADAEVANGLVSEVAGQYFTDTNTDDMNLTINVRSIADGSVLRNIVIPLKLASNISRGLMSKEDVATLSALSTRVGALEGQNARYLYTESTNPSANDIDAFAQTKGEESPYTGIAIVVAGTYHIWHFYSNDNIGWHDDGVDTVLKATGSSLGIVQGSDTAGKVYVESDGTMSLVGYDTITGDITSLENAMIQSIVIASGTNDGTIKVTVTINGVATTTDNISITGLGSAAFADTTDFANAEHTHANYLTEHQDISGKENNSNKVSSISNTTSTTLYPNNKAVVDYVDAKFAAMALLLSEV